MIENQHKAGVAAKITLITIAIFEATKKKLSTPPCLLDLLIIGALLSGLISFFATDRSITIADGGYRVLLMRLSLFLVAFLINNFIWIFINVLNQFWWKSQRLMQGNSALFIVSHVIGFFIIVSDFMHFYFFLEHWNIKAFLSSIHGVAHGLAPLNITPMQIIGSILVIVLVLYILLAIIKNLNPLGRTWLPYRCATVGVVLAISLASLMAVQRTIPSNFQSVALQQGIPWFQFVKTPIKYVEMNEEFSDIQSVKKKQEDLLNLVKERVESLPEKIAAKRKPNILFVHIESLRSDMLNNDYMPNLNQFAHSEGEFFANHYSSSNNTTGAMFGLLTGLTGPLYQHFRKNPFAPSGLALLKKAGYRFAISNSVGNKYQKANTLLLADFEEKAFTSSEQTIPVREQSMIDDFLAVAASITPTDAPRFDYLVINSPHFPYFYPEESEKFLPTIELGDISMAPQSIPKFSNNKQAVKNRFRNSVLYADKLLGRLFSGLKQTNYLENNIVVIVGDHGQEFWEHNRFSHGWSFVDEQTQVVAVVRFPDKLNTKYRYTSHSDIMPTILSYMELDADIEQLMNGKNLRHYQEEKDFATIAMGVIDYQTPNQEAVVGQGFKVQYTVAPEVTIDDIHSDTDDALTIQGEENTIINLVMESVEMATLRFVSMHTP